jgi:hypothetical protein
MVDFGKLCGAVIISYEKRSHGVVELLAARLRHRIALTYCDHPHELDARNGFRFIIVFSIDDLAGVVKVYHLRDEPMPLIIHIDDPETIHQCDYVELFPYVEVAPVAQAGLQDKSTTLKIILFERIIGFLEQLAARETPAPAQRTHATTSSPVAPP